jgi:amino acid transporter
MSNTHSDDERRLADLGYKQELTRSWSGFSNFAISFSIISILAGCFTTFAQAWNFGGPFAITIGWPLIAGLILIIGFCMSELASAYPTSGGIYWWAAKLGGAKAGFYTGWLNLIGLISVTASVGYGVTFYINTLLSFYSKGWAGAFGGDYIKQQFVLFLIVITIITLINLYGHHLLAVINNVSVWWHVFGSAVVVGILLIAPKHHTDASFFVKHINNSGFGDSNYWYFILPLGFLLTQYTITGFDASAHLSEETHNAHITSAKGIWKSIFYSAIGGYILLMSFLWAATKFDMINSADPKVNPFGQGSPIAIFYSALGGDGGLFKLIILITTFGQLFCVTACLTSCSRMMFAFSRDGALPGSKHWRKVNKAGTPTNAVIMSAILGVVLTLPALYKSSAGVPTAFYAVVSVCVISLYLAFMIPIYLRWKAGDSFKAGAWTLGSKYKWMNLIAVAEIVIISIYFIMPLYPSAVPFRKGFSWTSMNYAPLVTGGALILLWIWWHLSVKKWFKGPIKNV